MNFKNSKTFIGRITYYSSMVEMVKADPFGNTEFDVTLPKYIIVKDDELKTFRTYKISSWHLEKMIESEHGQYFGGLDSMLDKYDEKWYGGFKVLRDAKLYIEELEQAEIEYYKDDEVESA